MNRKTLTNDNQMKPHTIGIFDSGLGGLSVLQPLFHHTSVQNFVYLADTANLPYGSKGLDEVKCCVEKSLKFLQQKKVDVIVIACGTASMLHEIYNFSCKVPIITITEQLVSQAISATNNCKIAILGTNLTINSGIYKKKITKLMPNAEVLEIASQEFVDIVENNRIYTPETIDTIKCKLNTAITYNYDTIVLACTHFPWLKDQIAQLTDANIIHIDHRFADVVSPKLKLRKVDKQDNKNKTIKLYSTGDVNDFTNKVINLLNICDANVISI